MAKPAAGNVRVFRGQTREYLGPDQEPLLLPSLSRRSGSPMYDPAWLGAMSSFVGAGGHTDLINDFVTFRVWSPALVQHYGPGSHYLDVSHDIDVALWFATHHYTERWFMVEGNPGKQLPDRQYAVAWSSDVDPTVARTDRGGPVIYVFDVELWDGKGLPDHGQLVDLLAAGPIRHLAENATRLKMQSAALLFADPHWAKGMNLCSKLALRIYLAADFDLAQAADRKWVGDIYPQPGDDPLYQTLLRFPSYTQFDPTRLEQPLTIPFQLTRPLPLGGSPNVADLGGEGTYVSPKRLRFNSTPGQDLYAVSQVQDYLSLERHLEPVLFHAWLLEQGAKFTQVELAGKLYHLEDALPIFLEAALWRGTPGVKPGPELSTWIQSALPYGIADTIGGRSSDNVYIEISPLDFLQPGHPENQEDTRAVWLVRNDEDYALTLFRAGEYVYAFPVRYRYDPQTGLFSRQPDEFSKTADTAASFEFLYSLALKSLFVSLTVLRDLSPGYKPPPTYNFVIDNSVYVPSPLLEPQLANPRQACSNRYVVPKAMDGTRYLRASGGPRSDAMSPADPVETVYWLERYLPLVKDPSYRAWAAMHLAELNGNLGQPDRALKYADVALAIARTLNTHTLVEQLEQLRRSIQAPDLRPSTTGD